MIKENSQDAINWMKQAWLELDDKKYLISGAVRKFNISKNEAIKIYNKIMKEKNIKEIVKQNIKEWMGGIIGIPNRNMICDKHKMPANACPCQEEEDKEKNQKAKLPKGIKFMKETIRQILYEYKIFDVGDIVWIDKHNYKHLSNKHKSKIKPQEKYKVLHQMGDNVLIDLGRGEKASVNNELLSREFK